MKTANTNVIIEQLKQYADEKVYKHNIKMGASDNQIGVKMGDIRKIAKPLKNDHELALALWDTNILEARFVAVLNFNPKKISQEQLTAIAESENYAHLLDWLYSYVIKFHADKEELRDRWMNAKNPSLRRFAWQLTASKLNSKDPNLNINNILIVLEKEMDNENPLVQWTMNTALASIGIHYPEFRTQAIALGHRLAIYKDYPVSKGCVSPFAPIWIEEMVKRSEK